MPTPIPELDVPASLVMWGAYRAAFPHRPAEDEPVADFLGDSAELADELLSLVLEGTKTATATLVLEFTDAGEPLPRIGDHWVACETHGLAWSEDLEVACERFRIAWPADVPASMCEVA